jgi:hypothetical protein
VLFLTDTCLPIDGLLSEAHAKTNGCGTALVLLDTCPVLPYLGPVMDDTEVEVLQRTMTALGPR